VQSISIKKKLLLLIILPILGFICIGILWSSQTHKEYNDLKKTEKIFQLSTKMSSLIHEIQKERGYSSAFIGTEGKKFKQNLIQQRITTNNKRDELLLYIKNTTTSKYNLQFKEYFQKALKQLTKIEKKRKQIDLLLINNENVIIFFTNINNLFFNANDYINKDLSKNINKKNFIAYSQFLRSKDKLGIERAIGAYVLSKNTFDQKSKTYFINLVHAQNIYLDNFYKYSNKDSVNIFKKEMTHKKIKEANRIEKVIMVANKKSELIKKINNTNANNFIDAQSNSFLNDSAKYWFSLVSFKINKFKYVEDIILTELHNDIVSKKQELKNSFLYFIALFFLITLLIIIISYKLFNNLTTLFDNISSKLDIFFKYINKESTEVELFEDNLNDEELNSKINELNTKLLKSKDLISKNNKYLDEALSLSKLYEYAMEKSNIVLRVDLNRKITYANDLFYEISEYTAKELIGKPYSYIKHPDVTDEEVEKLWSHIEKGKVWKGSLKNISKSGRPYYSIATVVPIKNKDGKIIEYMGIRQDITEVINLHQELEDTQREVIYKMGEIGETRSKETGNHVKRVAEYSKILALKIGINKKEAEILKHASPMHDIGKVGIPDSILNKPGKLTKDEFEIMKNHSQIGYEMLKTSNRPILKASSIVSYQHHEKWDGSGYPRGLKGGDIHIYGRITAICDVFDALGSERPYKKAWEDEKIFEFFENEKGKHFDPKLVDIFSKNKDIFLEIRDKYKDHNKINKSQN